LSASISFKIEKSFINLFFNFLGNKLAKIEKIKSLWLSPEIK